LRGAANNKISRSLELVAGTHRPWKIVIDAAMHTETLLRSDALCAINAAGIGARIGGAREFADACGVTFQDGVIGRAARV
jgi:hypothetical protein